MNDTEKEFICKNAPCYIYNKAEIIKQCEKLKKAMPSVQFLYSVKANPFLPVVSTITNCGLGVDAASPQEVVLANANRLTDRQIFYSSPGKTKHDIKRAFGKCIFIADSFHELELLNFHAGKAGKTIKAGIRINPGFGMDKNTGFTSKFGIDEIQLKELSSFLDKTENIVINGIHIHIQSQILNADTLSHYYKNCYLLAERAADLLDIKIEFINFGSGIGTVYDNAKDRPVDLKLLSETISELDEVNRHSLQAKFIIETGRFLTCNAGIYYTRIVDKKISHGKTYLIVENGMNGFLRPSITAFLMKAAGNNSLTEKGLESLYTAENAFIVSVLNGETEKETATVVGNLCTALDIIAENIELPIARIGDIVSVSNAGSYGYSLSPLLFGGHQAPKQFLWE